MLYKEYQLTTSMAGAMPQRRRGQSFQ